MFRFIAVTITCIALVMLSDDSADGAPSRRGAAKTRSGASRTARVQARANHAREFRRAARLHPRHARVNRARTFLRPKAADAAALVGQGALGSFATLASPVVNPNQPVRVTTERPNASRRLARLKHPRSERR